MAVGNYTRTQRALHWLMAALLIGLLVAGQSRQLFERGAEIRDVLRLIHMGFGTAIFMLVWLRLWLRLRWTRPPISPPLPGWQRHAAALSQGLLYAAMIVLPLLGVALYITGGRSLPVLGWTLGEGHYAAWRTTLEPLHVIGGRIVTGLIAVHLLAALWHHHVRRDNTLQRMLPGLRRK